MKVSRLLAIVLAFLLQQSSMALELPLHPEDAEVLRAIVATEQLDVQGVEMPGWAKNGVLKSLAAHGVETKSAQAGGLALRDKPAMFLGFVYDENGRVLALSGNGPWLRNSSLRAEPTARTANHSHRPQRLRRSRPAFEFDGSGFERLADSKLVEIKIDLSFRIRAWSSARRSSLCVR